MNKYVFILLCSGCYGLVVAVVTGFTVHQWRLWVLLLVGAVMLVAGRYIADTWRSEEAREMGEHVQSVTSWWATPQAQQSRDAFAMALSAQLPRMRDDLSAAKAIARVRAETFTDIGYGRQRIGSAGVRWTAS